jgi:CheY-like chemotaxis protein
MNLALNAAAAMGEGGRLTLRTGRNVVGSVQLEVADTGSGIVEEIRDRVFEPFFTTKAAGEGSGLGLAVVHGIVTAHGGQVELESEVGRGTVFRVVLPAAEGVSRAEASQVVSEPARQQAGGSGQCILVVEDEADTRGALCAILEALGYRAEGAGSGEEARRRAAERRFDLVLTDVVLPDGRGNELARELVGIQPGIAVLLMSGYAPDWALREEVSEGTVAFLQKPFDMATLAERVRAELADAADRKPREEA